MPPGHRCIECGFCESNCPSRDVTLTPRQRITVFREINRLKQLTSPSTEETQRCAGEGREKNRRGSGVQALDGGGFPFFVFFLFTSQLPLRLKDISVKYEYDGQDTCAADGMCQVRTAQSDGLILQAVPHVQSEGV